MNRLIDGLLLLMLGLGTSCSSETYYTSFSAVPRLFNDQLPSSRYEPPQNRFLASSPWPMTHRNPYAQASSPYAGPSSASDFSPRISSDAPPVSVTLSISAKYQSGLHAVWGYALGEVFIIKSDSWEVASKLRTTEVQDDDEKGALSGAYNLIDKNNHFYVPYGQTIGKFSDLEESFNISKENEFTIPDALEGEMIVGMNLSFDGYIVFVTNFGRVGYLSRDFSSYSQVLIENQNADISNSIAIDESGGIFVLTAKAIHKVQIQTGLGLSHQWEVPYQSANGSIDGRLGGGSGTTPSLMGFGEGNDKFVVFADGQSLMNLVLVWRDQIPEGWNGIENQHPRVAAVEPITFLPHHKHNDIDLSELTSVTEQSILVRGYEAAVVSNKYGKPSPIMMRLVHEVSRRMNRNLSYGGKVVALSNHPRVSPKGVEKFTWSSYDRKLSSTWANDEISCPNGIPSMSEPLGIMYCVGANGPSKLLRGSPWTFEGISWLTGERVFSYELGNKFTFNSFYAGTEIGLDGSLISGVVGGALSGN